MFGSNEAGKVTVDWGDGIVESFDFVKTSASEYAYVCAFRGLNSTSFQGNGADWGFGNSTGGRIIPYPNHTYSDGDKEKDRIIVFNFTNQVVQFQSYESKLTAFPNIESNSLEVLLITQSRLIKEIPIDRIAKMDGMKKLTFSNIGDIMSVIPQSLFDMSNLTFLRMDGVFNLSNPTASNLRKIGNLKKLETVHLGKSNITTCVREFNELPILKSLNIASPIDGAPDYSEVSEINQNLDSYTVLSETVSRIEWLKTV